VVQKNSTVVYVEEISNKNAQNNMYNTTII